jgi:hypothetical protein
MNFIWNVDLQKQYFLSVELKCVTVSTFNLVSIEQTFWIVAQVVQAFDRTVVGKVFGLQALAMRHKTGNKNDCRTFYTFIPLTFKVSDHYGPARPHF